MKEAGVPPTLEPSAPGWLGTAEQLRTVLLRAADGITVQDASGRLRFANLAAARAMGFDDPEEPVRIPGSELMSRFELLDAAGNPLPEGDLPGRRLLRGGPEEGGIVRFRVRATGEERWSLVRPSAVRDADGRIEFIISSFQDVTALKESEQRLSLLADAGAILGGSVDYQETLNELARLVVKQLAVWCVVDVVEPDSGIRRVAVAHGDPEKVRLAEEVQGRYPTADSETGAVGTVLRTGEPMLIPIVTEEQLNDAAQDEEHAGYLRILGLRSVLIVPLIARDTVLGALTLVRSDPARAFGPGDLPITRELAARAAVAVDNARLLNDATEALRLRDDFLAIASHDMRTPLAAILGYLQLAQRRLEASDAPNRGKLAEYLASAEATTNRLTGLVTDLMDVSLLRSGQPLPLERATIDLTELASRIVDLHRRLAPDYTLGLNAGDDPVLVDTDARRLERVLDNLIGNAVKFSPSGGEIAVTVTATDEHACLMVIDHGRGIPEEELGGIFERYRRASNALGVRGTGLGLAGSREIVRQLGGEIEVASRLGEGSTFTVRLPLPVGPD
jgi:signal transduction histidine kinase